MRVLLSRDIDGAAGDVYYLEMAGISSETKPTTNVATGSKFYEVDTDTNYVYDEDSGDWTEAPSVADDVNDLKNALNQSNAATNSDIGKAHSPKTVVDGKVTEWQYVEVGGGSGAIIPTFVRPSVTPGTWTCDMTWQEVHNAVITKECTGCNVQSGTGFTGYYPLRSVSDSIVVFSLTEASDTYEYPDTKYIAIIYQSDGEITEYGFSFSANNIDDAAGAGDTNVTFSADKLTKDIIKKIDAPSTTGTAGQVLGLDSSLNPVWVDQSGGGQTDIGLSVVNGEICVTYEEASA